MLNPFWSEHGNFINKNGFAVFCQNKHKLENDNPLGGHIKTAADNGLLT